MANPICHGITVSAIGHKIKSMILNAGIVRSVCRILLTGAVITRLFHVFQGTQGPVSSIIAGNVDQQSNQAGNDGELKYDSTHLFYSLNISRFLPA